VKYKLRVIRKLTQVEKGNLVISAGKCTNFVCVAVGIHNIAYVV